MTTNSYQGQNNVQALLHQARLNRGMVFGVIIITALLAFELFNYSTTEFALTDLLGDLEFAGLRWATILSIAFCSIDFAGIARLFTPEGGHGPVKEVGYLFGAWMLAATMNAMLTWWGVSIAILENHTLGNDVVNQSTLLKIVPIFVAVLVWLIRVLIIGTFSVAGERLFDLQSEKVSQSRQRTPSLKRPQPAPKPKNRPALNQNRGRRSPVPRTAGSFTRGINTQAKSARFSAPRNPEPRTTVIPEPPTPPEPEYVGVDPGYPQNHSAAASAPKGNKVPGSYANRSKFPPRN